MKVDAFLGIAAGEELLETAFISACLQMMLIYIFTLVSMVKFSLAKFCQKDKIQLLNLIHLEDSYLEIRFFSK